MYSYQFGLFRIEINEMIKNAGVLRQHMESKMNVTLLYKKSYFLNTYLNIP